MRNTSWVKGLLFGTIFSVITALMFMLIGQAWAGGITSFWGESWLYLAVVVPFAVTFAVLGGYFHNRERISNRKLWLISLLCACLVTLFSGTIGAIIGEAIVRGGMDTINISGTLVWGTVYAFVLLPLTTPFARLLIGGFYHIITRDRYGSEVDADSSD